MSEDEEKELTMRGGDALANVHCAALHENDYCNRNQVIYIAPLEIYGFEDLSFGERFKSVD